MSVSAREHSPVGAVCCVATDAAVRRALFGSFPLLDVEPRQLRSVLRRSPRPDVLVVSSCAVDDDLVRDVARAAATGVLPTLVVACCRAQPTDLERSWRLAGFATALVTSPSDLSDLVSGLIKSSPQTALLSQLGTRFGITSSVVQRALQELAAGKPVSVTQLGRNLGVSRAAFYRLFEQAGLPPIDKVSLLFRLARSTAALASGASLDQAANIGGYASARSLQRALSKVGFSVAEAREGKNVFEAWHRWATE